jgi:hypothetical protein
MSLFKRLGEVLTPPPAKRPRQATPSSESAPGMDDQVNEQIRKQVRALIMAENQSDPEAVAASNEIRRIADRQDPYIIAARIQMQMEALSTRLSGLDSSRYDRIYALAGDLIQRHVFKEIAAIETGRSTLGPNIFATYCSDLMGNLMEGKGIGPATEVMVQIADRLLYDAIDTLDKRSIYLNIAEVAMRIACEQLDHRAETRQGQPLWPDPALAGPTVGAATAHVCGMHKQVARIRDACANLEVQPALSKDELKATSSHERSAKHVRYLQTLLTAVRPAGYLPVKARIEIRAGMLLAPVAPDQARKALLSAAQNFEAQGDKEEALFLRALSQDRFKRAASLYAHCGDNAGQVRAMDKLRQDGISHSDFGNGHLDSQF